jgi:superfamily II DNA/RNA helicase
MTSKHKTALLVLLKQPEATRSIVFVRKRERVHELAAGCVKRDQHLLAGRRDGAGQA